MKKSLGRLSQLKSNKMKQMNCDVENEKKIWVNRKDRHVDRSDAGRQAAHPIVSIRPNIKASAEGGKSWGANAWRA